MKSRSAKIKKEEKEREIVETRAKGRADQLREKRVICENVPEIGATGHVDPLLVAAVHSTRGG